MIGGGSTYTPELVEGFARLLSVPAELVLIDPAVDRLAVVGAFGQRILRRYGYAGGLSWTTDLDTGLDGADVVVVQLRVGGQAARLDDETFPLEYGCIGQETTGAGGLAKALRTVPVVLDIARRAPSGAWIIVFTNPVGIVTRALLDDGHRALGLCNVAIGLQQHFADLLGLPAAAVTLDHIGLNHLTWERAAVVDGVDELPKLLASHGERLASRVGLPARILGLTGTVPSYYLRYFYCHDAVLAQQQYGWVPRAERVAEIERELLTLYADPALDTKPALLGQRGGAYYSQAAVGLLASLFGDGFADAGASAVHAVNVRNRGTLPHLPDDAVIEVSCLVDADGAAPLSTRPLDPDMGALVAHVSGYEELAVQAAVHGGRDRVFRALLAHPLVGQYDLAERLTDRLLAVNAESLSWTP